MTPGVIQVSKRTRERPAAEKGRGARGLCRLASIERDVGPSSTIRGPGPPNVLESVNAITLDREIPRNWRFNTEEDEQKLLDAANPHLRAVIVALLDTAARPGEILSLQWRDVSLGRHELVFRAEKSKTRTERIVPISTRLLATLEMRKLDPAGEPFAKDAYVFGDELGRRVKSVRTAWENACDRAGLTGLQLRDLRHEAGSRFEEAECPVTLVSKILGHTNLTTTSRYLNIHLRGLHAAMEKLEAHRPAVAQPLHKADEDTQASVPTSRRFSARPNFSPAMN